MLGDKILFKDYHYKQASDVIDKVEENKNKKKIVCLIGGGAGTGKTETSILVQKTLYRYNFPSLLISLDDYYNTHWKERDTIRKEKGIDSVGVSEIWWNVLEKTIKNYRWSNTLELLRVNKYSGLMETITTPSSVKLLIIEGLYAGYLKDKADIFYNIEGSPKDTYEFRRERGKEDPDDIWRKQIIQKEYEEVERLKH